MVQKSAVNTIEPLEYLHIFSPTASPTLTTAFNTLGYASRRGMAPRRRVVVTCCTLGAFGIWISSSLTWTTSPSVYLDRPSSYEPSAVNASQAVEVKFEVDPFDSGFFVRGPPTPKFRDNLLPDERYITSWISAGWTNDVMTYINLIYLGMLTNRVPIVPPFTPSHIGSATPPIPFGDVFDVPRMRKSIGRPILEWHEVKNSTSKEMEDLGCWNVWESQQYDEQFPRFITTSDNLALDISYTKTPSWVKLIPRHRHDRYASFSALATLGFPEMRIENLVEPLPSKHRHRKLPPDERLLCYDYLYYVCAQQVNEFEYDYSPAWLFVGQHMHWTKELENLADHYVRKSFGIEVKTEVETPPFIVLHARRGDFLTNMCNGVPVDECEAPVSAFVRRVDEIKEEILMSKGIDVKHVIMTSDEADKKWWDEISALGWYRIDSSDIVESKGKWYPLLIDAVIQSNGVGFVGTDRSTMTTIARRRVQSWRGGPGRAVRWGKKGIDDH